MKVVELNGEEIPQKMKANKRNSKALVSSPGMIEVQNYFLEQKSSEIEADKFYNYFQSNGWKVGGKAPMQDWQAAARNWILNIPAFTKAQKSVTANQPTPGHLNTTSSKNYAEPL